MNDTIERNDRSTDCTSSHRESEKHCRRKVDAVRKARGLRTLNSRIYNTESPSNRDTNNKDGSYHTSTPRVSSSHRWSQQRSKSDSTAWQKGPAQHSKENTLTEDHFPSLGTDIFDARFTTPESNKLDWGSRVEEEEELEELLEEQTTKLRYKRKLLLSQEDNLRNSKRKPNISKPILTDVHKLEQRQKQIDIGKNTVAYGRFIAALPREDRDKGVDAITPDKFQMCSTRSWVGQIRLWRRRLHVWDPPQDTVEEVFSVSSHSCTSSQSIEDSKMDVMETDTAGDLFKDFDLDLCLTNDGLPL